MEARRCQYKCSCGVVCSFVSAAAGRQGRYKRDLRSGDDDLGVDELLVKLGVLALLVRGGDKGVSLVLEPLADAELVFGGA